MDAPNEPQAKRRSRWPELLLIGAAAIALTGLIGGAVTGARYEPTYRVGATQPTAFAAEGSHCSVTTMYVDDRTGEELLCQDYAASDPSPRERPRSHRTNAPKSSPSPPTWRRTDRSTTPTAAG